MVALALPNFLDQAGGAVAESSWNAFLSTPTGQGMLQQVQDRAETGVKAAAQHNAINLMLFALAGGAIGGTVFKGPLGIMAAAGLAVWAGTRLLADPTGEKAQQQQQAISGFGAWDDSCYR